MAGILKKAAVTLAAALSTAAASAQGFSIWVGPSPNDRPHYDRSYNDRPYSDHHHHRHQHRHRHDHEPRYDNRPHYPLQGQRYFPPENLPQKCNRAIFNQVRLDTYFPNTQVGFIEGNNYACRINMKTYSLSNTYNLETQSGQNAYESAKASAYDREYPRHHSPHRLW